LTSDGVRGLRVLVTGGHGFLGRFVRRDLAAAGAREVLAPSHGELELRDPSEVVRAFCRLRPDVVVHLAARVGGIGANQRSPGTFWRDNTLMGAAVIDGSRAAGCRRLVVLGTVCAYPKFTEVPFQEQDLWKGFPEETNAPYGVAKRALQTGLEGYRQEFGLASAYLLPANLYGPGDNFDLESSHVIPAMIRKCEEARLAGVDEVVVWGTGRPSREFLYVEDCSEAITLAAGSIDDPEPMNLGNGREVPMEELAHAVAAAVGYRGRFRWDPARPDGQPRRSLSTERAAARMGWRARTPLEEGLRRTVAWYRTERVAPA
jgi:GDP-L-fucose synthase